MNKIMKAEDTLVIYKKGNKHLVLSVEDAVIAANNLYCDGYEHFATIDPKTYIEHILNNFELKPPTK